MIAISNSIQRRDSILLFICPYLGLDFSTKCIRFCLQITYIAFRSQFRFILRIGKGVGKRLGLFLLDPRAAQGTNELARVEGYRCCHGILLSLLFMKT